jgi:hypothetical protein
MGEYEPHDSRNVTLKQERAPGEPPRTGPREGETRPPEEQQQAESGQQEQGQAGSEAELRERAIEQDGEELDAHGREGPERFERND